MKRFSVLGVLAATIVSVFAIVAPAQPATWHVAPAGAAFTGASGAWVWHVGAHSVTCTSTSLSGSVTGAGGAVANGPVLTAPWNAIATVTLACSGITNAGVNYTVSCRVASLNTNANGYNGGITTTEGASAGLSTAGSLSGILCTAKPTANPSVNCSTVTGTVPVTYTNPASLAAGTGAANQGALAWTTTGQSLTTVSVGGCIVWIGSGSTTFSAQTYTISGSPSATVAAPHIWAN
ncbi:MAG: hypothetical protein JWQ20_271 [Conexibacter sp.]|nr:hypothetical protein [Conexibacter sp.]